MNRRPVFLMTVLCFGFAFFYFPILSMMVHSFNGSRLATVWGGFSTTWYVSLMSNKQVGAALVLSLKIALTSATAATILGTLAGITLARLILLAQWIGWPGRRGFTRVTLAHIRFSLVDRTTVIHARLIQSDHAIKEAAMDLGSRPWQVLFDVTLPVIFPAILSGWLLAFTISLDDVVITSFTTGPGSTTLPLLTRCIPRWACPDRASAVCGGDRAVQRWADFGCGARGLPDLFALGSAKPCHAAIHPKVAVARAGQRDGAIRFARLVGRD